MAHKKAGGSSRNGRDTAGRRLGVKKFGGEAVIPGNIIIRQRGTKWHPGANVGIAVTTTIAGWADRESRRLGLAKLIANATVAAAILLLLDLLGRSTYLPNDHYP